MVPDLGHDGPVPAKIKRGVFNLSMATYCSYACSSKAMGGGIRVSNESMAVRRKRNCATTIVFYGPLRGMVLDGCD